jgi:hypothetical protein
MENTTILYIIIILFVTIAGVYFLFKRPTPPLNKDKTAEEPQKTSQNSNLMRIQSYERLVIFAERIGFKSLIDRLSSDILNAKEL